MKSNKQGQSSKEKLATNVKDASFSNGHLIQLPESNRRSFQEDAEVVQVPDGEDFSLILSKAQKLANKHLESVKPVLKLLTQPQGASYVVINNIPIDQELPLPPTDGKRPKVKKIVVSELSLLSVAAATGVYPMAYKEEKDGALIHEIAPSLGQERSLSNGGRVPLGFHTDASILKRPYRPDYLFLLALNNESATPTNIVELDDVLKTLKEHKPDLEQTLREPRFRDESPASFVYGNGKVIKSEPRPLIYTGPAGEDEIAANLPTVTALDEEAKIALKELLKVLPLVAKSIVLFPGQLLAFNNHRCLHGRPRIQGKRWLQRVYCRLSLEDLRCSTPSSPDCHVFESRFVVLE